MNAPLLKLHVAPDLVDQVYQALLGAISDGTLAPGARITQEDLARQLSVSRQPVLQALRLLKQDGLVLDAPGRGVLVAPLTAEGTAAVYQVRGALDALAARLAAQQRAQLDAKLVERGRKAARGRNVQAMIEADAAFHNAVYAAARNPLIARSAHLHWAHIRRAMGAVLQASSQRETVWGEHAAIAEAIAAGDAARAERLMHEHDARASEHITRHLDAAIGAEARHNA
ncbi:GntR family transcriptional regulator [Piscinibacter sp.]|uniref:GntR family transcriptional regulator n=1 Tax=Piscinibacter sp. TaxID=1903157 RepID=UPI0039E5CC83